MLLIFKMKIDSEVEVVAQEDSPKTFVLSSVALRWLQPEVELGAESWQPRRQEGQGRTFSESRQPCRRRGDLYETNLTIN